MKTARKLLSVLLALTMALAMAPIPALAAPGYVTPAEMIAYGISAEDRVGNLETNVEFYFDGSFPWSVDDGDAYQITLAGIIPDGTSLVVGDVEAALLPLEYANTVESAFMERSLSIIGVDMASNGIVPPGEYRIVVYGALPGEGGERVFCSNRAITVIEGDGYPYNFSGTSLEVTDSGGAGQPIQLTLHLDLGLESGDFAMLTPDDRFSLTLEDMDVAYAYGADFADAVVSSSAGVFLIEREGFGPGDEMPELNIYPQGSFTVLPSGVDIVIDGVLPLAANARAKFKAIHMLSGGDFEALGYWEDMISLSGGAPQPNISISTLTVPAGSETGVPTTLTLTLKGRGDVGAGDTVILMGTGLDFSNASLDDSTIFNITQKGNGAITLAFKSTATITSMGIPVSITDVAPSAASVSASASLTIGSVTPITTIFPALTFAEPQPGNLEASTLTRPDNAMIGRSISLTLALVPSKQMATVAGDSITLESYYFDFSEAAVPAGYTITASRSGKLVFIFDTAADIPTAGTEITISGVKSSSPSVTNAKLTLTRGGAAAVSKTFPTLTFGPFSLADCTVKLTVSENSWVAPVSGILNTPITVTAKVLDCEGNKVTGLTSFLYLSLSGSPYVKLDSGTSMSITDGEGSLTITKIRTYTGFGSNPSYTLGASGSLRFGGYYSSVAGECENNIMLSASARYVRGHVTIDKDGDNNPANDAPYGVALVTLTINGHTEDGVNYPEMTLTAMSDLNGDYSIAMPTPHNHSGDDLGVVGRATISVAKDTERCVLAYSSNFYNSGSADNPVMNFSVGRYAEIELFVYNHPAYEMQNPDYETLRSANIRILDDSLYWVNPMYYGIEHPASNIWHVPFSYIKNYQNNEAKLTLTVSPKSPLRLPQQSISVEMGAFNADTLRYTAAVDFKPSGYMEVINPESAETTMAVRFFYKNPGYNLWFVDTVGMHYVQPGQRATFGSAAGETGAAILAVPKEFAGYLASYRAETYYNADTGIWSVPGLEPDEYIVRTGTVKQGVMLSLQNTEVPAADTTRHAEQPDNAQARLLGIKGNSAVVAFSFTSVDDVLFLGGMFVKVSNGLVLNADPNNHYFVLPNGVRATLPFGAEGYFDGKYRDYYSLSSHLGDLTLYDEQGKRLTFSQLKPGETLLLVVTFDLRSPADLDTLHSLEFTYQPYTGPGLLSVANSFPVAAVSFKLAPNVTLSGQSYTDGNTVAVSGNAAPSAVVELYVDDSDVPAATTTANKTGKYSANVPLFGGRDAANIENGEFCDVIAKSGGRESAALTVVFAKFVPQIIALGDVTHKAILISPPRTSSGPKNYQLGDEDKFFANEVTNNFTTPTAPGSTGGSGSHEEISAMGKFVVSKALGLDMSKDPSYGVPYIDFRHPEGLFYHYKNEYPKKMFWNVFSPCILRYSPGEQLEYRVALSSPLAGQNDGCISKMWVNIANEMGGNEYVMPAFFDESEGVWIAKGELPTVNFVPGNISVDFTLKLGAELAQLDDDADYSLDFPAFDFDGQKAAAFEELRKARLHAGMLEDESLAAKLWDGIVEAAPDMATMQVTDNPDDTITVAYESGDGPVSIAGNLQFMDMTDPANAAKADTLLSSEKAIPLGETGAYAMEAVAHYTQDGQSKAVPLDNFVWMLSEGESMRATADALGIDYNVRVEYTEFIRLPEEGAEPFRARAARASGDISVTEGVTTVVNVSIPVYTPDPGDAGLDIPLKDGLSVDTGNVMRAIAGLTGLKNIYDNTSANIDIKNAFKEYEGLLLNLSQLSQSKCAESMSFEERMMFSDVLDKGFKNWKQFYNWQRNTRMWNNFKIGFDAGSIIFTAATMGASGSAMVFTRLGSNINTALTAGGGIISIADIGMKMTAGDFMKMALQQNIEDLYKLENQFMKHAMLKCRTPKGKFRIEVDKNGFIMIYDPSGFAYENGDPGQKVSGVLAEIWTADDAKGTNARLWTEAGDYGQVNPQITSEDGWYAWDVPIGWWQVRLTKNGYQEARSEWLPVLPVQLGVNLEMKPKSGGGNIGPGGSNSTGGSATTPEGGKTTVVGGNTVTTPKDQDPVANTDGALTLPGGGTIITPGGTVITVPPGTTVSKSGRTVTLPNSDKGADVKQGEETSHIDPGLTIEVTDNSVPLGGLDIFWNNPFTDVKESDWFYKDVLFVYTHGLMVGTGADQYSPGLSLTRGMIVTVLYRHAGSPDVSGLTNPFGDVSLGTWYTDAVIWAADKGIVAGIGSGKYAPDASITRQDLAVILNRYAEKMDLKLPETRVNTVFRDDADIANYAKEAIERFFKAGIISGYPNGNFGSKDTATRAEVSAMLHRFLEFAEK